MVRQAVYTALLGGYEVLNEAQRRPPGVDFVCFTDDATLRSDVWTIIVVEPEFPGDPHRSQRRIKILGHPALVDYDETLYIDNSVSLTGDVRELLGKWLVDADIAFARHSFRDTVADEFVAVRDARLDDHYRIAEQQDHYQEAWPDVLAAPVLWGGMIARRSTPRVDAACSTWFDHVLRYSRRDQLSLQAALVSTGTVAHIEVMDNRVSVWHRWPVPLKRAVSMPAVDRGAELASTLASLASEVAAHANTLRELDAVRQELDAGLQELDAVRQELDAVRQEMGTVPQYVEEVVQRMREESEISAQARVAEATAILRASTSWRATAGLRWLGSLARRTRDGV